ncbi:MAG TPA: class II fumarate hydratase, partial [Chromatiales bacterium]|nr:class II fumarate hydratase [Chromatiales bacterium]
MSDSDDYRIEHDSMGELRVPAHALWGAQTQRAVENFPISGQRMPRAFIQGLGLVKAACARVNAELGLLDAAVAEAIVEAAEAVARGEHDDQFPVDVFQTGSGTSSNMNANEVIARLASERLGGPVHPNDQVNRSQSSNDVIPTVIHVSACLRIEQDLIPALDHLERIIRQRAAELDGVVTTGRTHLMDAMPIRLSQELGGWASQIAYGRQRIESTLPRLRELAIGGTAVGTGINAPEDFGQRVAAVLAQMTGIPFVRKPDLFEALSAQDAAVEASGQLRVIAVGLMKIANDLRLMNSGPLAGIGEIALPALQPGSSIMPGKVNPVIPEAVCMVAAQVMGNDATIGIAGQAGNFQLNVMLPVIAYNLIQSIELLSHASAVLADKAIHGFTV